MTATLIITFICFISVIVSYIAFRQGAARSADDYFVAGSSLGYFVLIFSMLASFLSAFSMFGMSSLGYRTGYGALYVLTVNLVPLGFLWYFLHRKTFILGRTRKWMSMGAPFGDRYGKGMRIIIPIVVLMSSIPFLVAQIQAIGAMLEAMSQGLVSYHVGIFFVPVFIALYLMMGGMKGAAWVNTLQGVFFTAMVFVIFFGVMSTNGGFTQTMDLVHQKHPELFQLGWNDGKVWSYSMVFGFSTAMCLGCICMPQPYMHAYASRSANGFKAMVLSFGAICLVIITMPTLIGIAARLIVPGLEGVEADKVYGLAASRTFPQVIAAIIVSGGFTAAMSTVNGMVFGNAMNITNDLCKLIFPDLSSHRLIRIAQLCVLVIMAACVAIGWNPNTPVAELSVIAFGMIAVTIFPLWGAYFWRRATAQGAIWATIIGVGSNVALFFIGGKQMVLFPSPLLLNLNGFLFSLIISGIVFFGVCMLTQPGAVEKRSLALFFHPALEEAPIFRPIALVNVPEELEQKEGHVA
ncbi:sodium:solute symporter family protein [Desulfococcus multivorans]|uniref:Na+/solute symporter n=1 Tax=Desulfococcus multivorans DSM 2059 TaxID=1121405 RepID=S7T7C4_DESML|nr:sodium:solute symporter family protein [Desulfococcus multivorans]AOY60699.1 putative Na+/solute symporter [Desulfococcus multivorans]AQV02780.1 Na+:solute symporter [Desulfococcus multivorans]EPR32486.1 Na+/solute symporter [Desulfococcus multivorans DSM 2059]SJZ91593.1 solute:Na+ symporter, SSS family [Desulfococcus multivorans DSM 2059]